jgi:hypothetical protein
MGKREIYAGFWWRNLKERDDLEDLGIDRILKWILNISCDGVNWINLFQDKNKWWPLTNMVMNFWLP